MRYLPPEEGSVRAAARCRRSPSLTRHAAEVPRRSAAAARCAAEGRKTGVGDRLPLPVLVQLSSELARQTVRQDSSFAKKQESPPAILVVVRRGRHTLAGRATGRRSHSIVVVFGVAVVLLLTLDRAVVHARAAEPDQRDRNPATARHAQAALSWSADLETSAAVMAAPAARRPQAAGSGSGYRRAAARKAKRDRRTGGPPHPRV